jgi:hypothetical protein
MSQQAKAAIKGGTRDLRARFISAVRESRVDADLSLVLRRLFA